MKVVTAPFSNMRLNSTIPGTKTRITISQYSNIWVWESDIDITAHLLKGQPNIDSELEDSVAEFKTDNLTIDLEDQDETIRNLLLTADKHFLIKFEKGFMGIVDWLVKFDGIIDSFETIEKARNIISIVAYSMETEFEYHLGSESISSGGSVPLPQAVNELWDVSYIPITNRIISVPGPYSWGAVPLCDYTGWNAREALDNLALVNGCIWKRTERDTAMFIHRNYIGGTFDLDANLYNPKYEYRINKGLDGVHAENTTLGIEANSIGYVNGINTSFNNQLLRTQCKQCHWSAEENYSFQRYNKRIFRIPAFFLLELEPLDRVNLTLRDKDGNLDETIFTQFTGIEYNGTDKMTRIKLEERKPRVYEKYVCDDDNIRQLFGATWQAQTYTIGSDGYDQVHDIIHVRLLMYKTGNPGLLTVGIRNTVAGVPFGADLCNITVNTNTFTAVGPGLWYQFDFTITAAQALATQYAIVCRCPAGNAGNAINWRERRGIGATNYTGGSIWTSLDGGLTWPTNYPNDDFMFETWGEIT